MTQAVQHLPQRAHRVAPLVHERPDASDSDFGVLASGVSEPEQVMALLAQACPSFAAEWREHQQVNGASLLYIAATAFAHHLLSLHKADDLACFPQVAACIERVLQHGSEEVREFIAIGVLEGLQNVWSADGADPEDLRAKLGDQGRRWWQSLNDFWCGRVPYIGYAS
ncbi:hypothetical protein OOT46_12545 [Aquabacterium sp. A7-Y]|uniref:DUF7674 family protein n=1 Tax=Aquabacterium sp. A7-Y TaxID=1349605 RepID=UPI00223CF49D|nr:hypothetical protein [Aquabacterium sp. A7-Y]MCW7538672.1 hypothetical protein [Aquabacterium sp. A7-Y]